jgi:hypothetical protein
VIVAGALPTAFCSLLTDFWTANVNNKFTRPNKRFGPDNKKAIFEPYFSEN